MSHTAISTSASTGKADTKALGCDHAWCGSGTARRTPALERDNQRDRSRSQ
jgi:hypothetical protein